ncbi:MAG TPA: Calx-beta domain-containing protein, partial [Thermoanaerobaculia bacterium]|nr:Calx-beta domain-containing protein [Thermoanaerobaculia bacterium]
AADRSGDILVAWGHKEGFLGPTEVLLRRFSSLGAPLGEPRRLLRTSGGTVTSVDVAATPDGEVLVTWLERTPYLVFGQVFGATGEPLSPPFEIGRGSATATHAPQAVPTEDGFLVVWPGQPTEEPSGKDDAEVGLYGKPYDLFGEPRGEPFLVEACAGCYLAASFVQDASGHFFVSWRGAQAGILLQEIHSDGSLGLRLGWSPWQSRGPQAAAGWGDGELAVIWESPRGLFAQRLASGGSAGVLRLSPADFATGEGEGPVSIRVERREGNLGDISVEYSVRAQGALAGKDFLPVSGTVHFAGGESVSRELSVPILDDDLPEGTEAVLLELTRPLGGARLGAPAQIRIQIRDDDAPSPLLATATVVAELDWTDDAMLEMGNPLVAALANGGFAALWQVADRWAEIPILRSKLFDAADREIAGSFAPTSEAFSPHLVAHPAGGFTIVSDDWEADVGQRFNPLGQPHTGRFVLPDPLTIAAAKAGGLFTLTSNGKTLWLNTYGGRGQSLRPAQAVNSSLCFLSVPVLASDARGRAIIAWRGPWPACNRVFVRRTDSAGHLLPRTVALESPAARNTRELAMAAAPDGRFVLVWEGEGDGSGFGLFGRVFAADGRPASEVFQVNGRRLGDQTRPRVAMQGDGRFVVIFQSQKKLHAQYFSPEGRPLGSDFLPDSEFPWQDHSEGSLATDAEGRYVVAWSRVGRIEDSVAYRRFKAPRQSR